MAEPDLLLTLQLPAQFTEICQAAGRREQGTFPCSPCPITIIHLTKKMRRLQRAKAIEKTETGADSTRMRGGCKNRREQETTTKKKVAEYLHKIMTVPAISYSNKYTSILIPPDQRILPGLHRRVLRISPSLEEIPMRHDFSQPTGQRAIDILHDAEVGRE